MFYTPLSKQQIFAEITNPVHGGPGWELGNCMWSPSRNRTGGKSWELMNECKPGDLVIHLVKRNSGGYNFTGVSSVLYPNHIVNSSPPKPADWAKMAPYYRVNLTNYLAFETPLPVERFYRDYSDQIRSLHGSFFNEYGKDRELRTAQRYIARIPRELYAYVDEFLSDNGLSYSPAQETFETTDNEPAQPDIAPPPTTRSTLTRIVRDTKMVKELKEEFDYRCQICGERILLPNMRYYAEGHHLQPLGGDYRGPDVRDNIIIVCPTHHAEFDYGSIAIDPDSLVIKHVDKQNYYNDRELAYKRSDLNHRYIAFHYHEICGW